MLAVLVTSGPRPRLAGKLFFPGARESLLGSPGMWMLRIIAVLTVILVRAPANLFARVMHRVVRGPLAEVAGRRPSAACRQQLHCTSQQMRQLAGLVLLARAAGACALLLSGVA